MLTAQSVSPRMVVDAQQALKKLENIRKHVIVFVAVLAALLRGGDRVDLYPRMHALLAPRLGRVLLRLLAQDR